MSDTPETDNAAFAACEVHEDCGVVYAEFAGQLERERDELRTELNFTIRLSRTWEDDVKRIASNSDYWKAEAERWRTTK
jgi:hypothetical protein